MPISINGTGTITGISAGGLPDDCITTAEIAGSAVTTAKVTDGNITYGKLSTSATEADNAASRVAKAWVNFNGTGTVAIRSSFNVSSITDNGTGDYTINFTTAMSDANYSLTSTLKYPASAGNTATPVCGINRNTNLTTTSARVNTNNVVDALVDMDIVCIAIFR